MKKIFGAFVGIALLATPIIASAQSSTDLQAQVSALLVQIQQAQQALAKPAPAIPATAPTSTQSDLQTQVAALLAQIKQQSSQKDLQAQVSALLAQIKQQNTPQSSDLQAQVQALLAQISQTQSPELKAQVAALLAQIQQQSSQNDLQTQVSGLLGQINQSQDSQNQAPQSQSICVTIPRNLTLGQSGSDVANLQTYLIQGGYLSSQYGTGYYGFLTAQAVGKAQVALGILSSTNDSAYGITGPRTRAVLACTAGSKSSQAFSTQNPYAPTHAVTNNPIASGAAAVTATYSGMIVSTSVPNYVGVPVVQVNGTQTGYASNSTSMGKSSGPLVVLVPSTHTPMIPSTNYSTVTALMMGTSDVVGNSAVVNGSAWTASFYNLPGGIYTAYVYDPGTQMLLTAGSFSYTVPSATPAVPSPISSASLPVKLSIVPQMSQNSAFIGVTIVGNSLNRSVTTWQLDISCDSGITMLLNGTDNCNSTQRYYTSNMYDPTQDYLAMRVGGVNAASSAESIRFTLTALSSSGAVLGSTQQSITIPGNSTAGATASIDQGSLTQYAHSSFNITGATTAHKVFVALVNQSYTGPTDFNSVWSYVANSQGGMVGNTVSSNGRYSQLFSLSTAGTYTVYVYDGDASPAGPLLASGTLTIADNSTGQSTATVDSSTLSQSTNTFMLSGTVSGPILMHGILAFIVPTSQIPYASSYSTIYGQVGKDGFYEQAGGAYSSGRWSIAFSNVANGTYEVLIYDSQTKALAGESGPLTVGANSAPAQTNPVVINSFAYSGSGSNGLPLLFNWSSNLSASDLSFYRGGCYVTSPLQGPNVWLNSTYGANGSFIYTRTITTDTAFVLTCVSGGKDGSPSASRQLIVPSPTR